MRTLRTAVFVVILSVPRLVHAQAGGDEPMPGGPAGNEPAPAQPENSASAPQPAAPPVTDWAATFAPEGLAARLPPGSDHVVIAEAGMPDALSQRAVVALKESLARTGMVRQILDGQYLGPIAGLDDRAIVARASSLPVELVLVLRVFPASQGYTEGVFVGLYGRDGQFRGGISGQRGVPLGPVAPPAPAYVPAPMAAAPLSAELQQLHRYEQLHIGFDFENGGRNIDNSGPYMGNDHRPLRGPAFYRAIGREDWRGNTST